MLNEAFFHMSVYSIICSIAKRCVVLLSIIAHLEPYVGESTFKKNQNIYQLT